MPEQEIDNLRERWEANRSPALTRELAGEYRRRGDHTGALEVLASGLRDHPDDVGTRVAKGRCHLELDQVQEASRELVSVAMDDPAHLVANQLLAEAHARQGDLARARDRLDLFELLGGSGSELEMLERQLRVATGDEMPPASPEPSSSSPIAPPDGEPEAVDPDPFVLHDWIQFDESRYAAALFAEGVFAQPEEVHALGRESLDLGVDAVAPGGEPTPTLTLGELYRKQGHRDEAVGIYRQILERQPGNVEAARALGELEREGGWPLSAEDLLGQAADREHPGEGRSSGEVLRRYRERLRGGG